MGECTKILEDRIVEENIEVIIGMKIITEEVVGVGLEKDHFQGILIIEGTIEAWVIVDQGLDQDGIRCYKCREYHHFTKDCPTSKEEREIEQVQQMFYLDEEQTSLKMLATDTYDSLKK